MTANVDNEAKIRRLSAQLGQLMIERDWKVTTAESCTGGGIAAAITDIAGSSAWFERGYITYSNNAKVDMLKVDPAVLASHGAVSSEVVEQMAEGSLDLASAQLAVAVSGIAGPDGGSDDKPVGTVWVAWKHWSTPVYSHRFHFDGDRNSVRAATIIAALQGLIELSKEK